MKEIMFENIHPFVRYVHKFDITEDTHFFNQRAYDQRLFYVLHGNGSIDFGSKSIEAKPGMVFLFSSGILYSLRCQKGEVLTLIGVNFDYMYEHASLSSPIVPGKYGFRENERLEDIYLKDVHDLNETIILDGMETLADDLLLMLSEYRHSLIMSNQRLSGILLSVIVRVLRAKTLEKNGVRSSDSTAEEILRYIRRHYNEPLTNQQIGKVFGYHPNYINQLTNLHTGMSAHKYLLNYRIQRAVELLRITDQSIYDISKTVGFNDYNYFLKYFKKQTGVTTSRFRSK